MQDKIKQVLREIQDGNYNALAKGITIVENELPGHDELLLQLKNTDIAKVVGITGPPGAGKSTIVNALLHYWTNKGKKIAVIAIDPSSPFNYGALLGDRIRMSDFYTNPNVFIRSLATRGELGGLHHKIIEITDLVKNAPFDIVLVETVGVGQTEVEIAALADCTVVALIPSSGDVVQTMKAGIMEIANIFVVNKSDTDDAESMYNNLSIMLHERDQNNVKTPVIKTIATEQKGIAELAMSIEVYLSEQNSVPDKRVYLITKKCLELISSERMKDIDAQKIKTEILEELKKPGFNLYAFIKTIID